MAIAADGGDSSMLFMPNIVSYQLFSHVQRHDFASTRYFRLLGAYHMVRLTALFSLSLASLSNSTTSKS